MDLIDAIIKKDAKQVKFLLENGINPNHTDDWANVTPLHYAVLHNAIDITALLLAAGASINTRSHVDEQTPLELAEELGHTEIVKLLKNVQSA